MKCSHCSAALSDSSFKFCPSCGSPQVSTCKVCSTPTVLGARFCGGCGSSISAENTVSQKFSPIRVPPPPSNSSVSPQYPAFSVPKTMIQRFAQYWAKATEGPFACWKFSETSLLEAQRLAKERVALIAHKFRYGGLRPDKYLYSDQRLREPVIAEVHGTVISRNAYGCLVLNTINIMFVDIDFKKVSRNPRTGESITYEFGKRAQASGLLAGIFKDPEKAKQDAVIKDVEEWTSTRPGWGWRIYRTSAGLRLLATHSFFDPESIETQAVFKQLDADPLYGILCKVQKCFRARLTPKPWRCDFEAPQEKWPWESDNAEYNFKKWEQKYLKRSAEYSTCSLIKIVGNSDVHPQIRPIVDLHDEYCRIESELPLA